MKLKSFAVAALSILTLTISAQAEVIENPQPVMDLLDRVGGAGSAEKFVIRVDDSYKSSTGAEMFKISAQDGKPCITGTTLSAATTGIGWYLNHYAKINVAWNNPHPTFGNLPTPTTTEEHTTAAKYRYYLNYCTFSYSMSTWTWSRWQEEIDWMALHGINMPLQIIGLEEVWRKFLMVDCGYTLEEVNDFVAGPSFMAWFGMNNLEGHGGPNKEWWYKRQAQLGKQINERMKSLGIEPVLPGFYQVPSNFAQKTGFATVGTGYWCSFSRPHLVSVNDETKLNEYGEKYYQRLNEVLGKSKYYSMDPFHEGASLGTQDYALKLYQKLYNVMNTASPGSKWVIQQWQWNGLQWKSLDGVPKGGLVVLDLNAERVPAYNSFQGHETVFSTIFNFGGRTGYDGRVQGLIDEYFKSRETTPTVVGIGAAPEAIEQTPVMYELLFELPWMSEKPDAATWIAEYAKRRYGVESAEAAKAWENLRTSALSLTGQLQGPHEAIICSRPSLDVNRVSSWGGADIFYDRAQMTSAAYQLLEANLTGLNYSFDLVDISRQALTDYSKSLLAGIKEAHNSGDTETFNKRRDAFLQLILDIDQLLNTNKDFMLGHWTKRARAMADEIAGTTDADRDWLELDNARTIITTWGEQAQAESGGLRDYSYREWGGMLKDFYYQRWKIWFDNGMRAPNGGWFQWEWNWAHTNPNAYKDQPEGDTREVASSLLPKYLSKLTSRIPGQEPVYIDRLLRNDYTKKFYDLAAPESTYAPDINGNAEVATIAIDFNRNGLFDESETRQGGSYTLTADAPVGERNVLVKLTDGTTINYTLQIIVNITDPRTVSVRSADPTQGSVSIVGAQTTSVTNTEVVSMLATPASKYEFDHWEDAAGNNLGNDNPINYYGKENAEFIAHFILNKWGVPGYNGNSSDLETMESGKQYINHLSVTQGGETKPLYTSESCPKEHFVLIPTRIKAAPGQEFTFQYTQPGTGMEYLYLSAYCDFDRDGNFNTSDELLGTIGTRNATNSDVGAGTFTIHLPFDAVKGTTHIRLRFDSAWGTEYDDNIKAFPPEAATNRIIYEIILEVTDAADFVSTVTVASSDPRLGSVRSENETTHRYAPGDEVILTGFPVGGAKVARFVDSHGRELPREWMSESGNSINFKAYDNAQITCVFEAMPLTAGDYKLSWAPMNNGNARITGVTGGTGHILDLANTEAKIGSVADGALDELKNSVDEIVLPDAEFIGNDPAPFFTAEHKGDGTQNKITTVNPEIAGTDSWIMTIKGTNDGSSFNEWGSALYGNGDNCLADDYSNGWSQYYLDKDGTLEIKWDCGNDGKMVFNEVKLIGDFSIVSIYNAETKTLTVTASASGKSQTQEKNNSSTMWNINKYATAIPTGINYTLSFAHPTGGTVLPGEVFSGFRMLHDYSVAQGNSVYVIRNGVACEKGRSSKVVGYPEGRLFMHPFTLTSNGKTLWANPSQQGENLGVTAGEMPANELTAHWMLKPATNGKVQLSHLNSSFGANADHSALHATAPAATDYSMVYGTAAAKLQIGTKVYQFNGADGQVSVTAPGRDFAITLPFGAQVPSTVTAYTISGVSSTQGCKLDKVETIEPGEAVIIRGAQASQKLTFEQLNEMTTAATQNLLHGTTMVLPYPGEYYILDSEGNFRLHNSGDIDANSAYLLKSELPSEIGETFTLDNFSSTDCLQTINGASEVEVYDLQGRRVGKISRGIYIINGHKTIIR